MVRRNRDARVVANVADVSIGSSVQGSGTHNRNWVRAPAGHPMALEKHHDGSMGRRFRESNFFITINPNQGGGGERNAQCVRLMEGVLKDLGTTPALRTYIEFGPKRKKGKYDNGDKMNRAADTYRNDKWEDAIVPGSIKFDASVETGPKKNRVHAHIMLEIQHYSMIQVNIPRLQALTKHLWNEACERNGYVGRDEQVLSGPRTKPNKIGHGSNALPYVDARLMPAHNWVANVKEYIRKGMSSVAS